jgi:phage tail sheath protein FI
MSVLVVAARFCRRHQALLLVDPPLAWSTTQGALESLREWPFHSADALMFFPRIAALNRLTGEIESFAPSAAAAALIVRDDATRADLWGEAEDTALLRPAAQPTLWVDRAQRVQLAQRGVNSLRATRSAAREDVPLCTLAGELAASADARWLGARRLQLQLCASIERGTRWVTIEGNTARTRERAARQVERFLQEQAEAGAFAGTERNRHYFVLCDERINGPAEQAHGVFRLLFGYQSPQSPTRHTWLVEHRPAASHTRAISINQLAAVELS